MGDGVRGDDRLGIGLIALGFALAANSLLGPLASGAIRYRFSEALISQGIGLDAVSLLIVAPMCVWVGARARRGHPAAGALALGPTLYAAYMSVQYAIGPEYLRLPGNNERFFPLHLGTFVLAWTVAAGAWTAASTERLPLAAGRHRGRVALLLFGLGALLALRYLPALAGLVGGEPSLPEYRENPTSFLLIAWMDLGIFLPASVAAGVGLSRGRPWAETAAYAIVGWFALVGLAVAAMTVVMRLRGDPTVSPGQVLAFGSASVALAAVAVVIHRPLFGTARRPDPGRK